MKLFSRMKEDREGFTLIELLIVLAIIGLLSTLAIVALTNAQQTARDVKREADLNQIQTALELYWSQAGTAAYPDVYINSVGESSKVTATMVESWAELQALLDDYISALPTDPDHGGGSSAYTYIVFDDDDADDDDNQTYFIAAGLESSTRQSLTQDVDGSSIGGSNYDGVTSLATAASNMTINCDDPTYCLTGSTQ